MLVVPGTQKRSCLALEEGEKAGKLHSVLQSAFFLSFKVGVSCSPSWSVSLSTQAGIKFKLWDLLPLPAKSQDYRRVIPRPV